MLAFSGTLWYTQLITGLPSLEVIPSYVESPAGYFSGPTRLYDRSGEHLIAVLENPAATDRRYLTIDQLQPNRLPSSLTLTTVAKADPNYWTNHGFEWSDLRPESHPTIAQKLVAEFLLWNEPPTILRALRERLLAAQMVNQYGREKILEWYLNTTNYGHLAYGADAAALVYFGKHAWDLSLAESAVLAATAEAPALNPIDAPLAALERKDQLLKELADSGLISADQYRQSAQEKLNFRTGVKNASNLAPAFTELLTRQLTHLIEPNRLARGGLDIITTLDYDLQVQATCASQTQRDRLSKPEGEASSAGDGNDCVAARLLPTFPILDKNRTKDLGAEIIILDPSTGQVLAMVEGSGQDNHITHLTGHPPGSLITPLVYLTAFTRGMSPASLLWDIPNSLIEGLEDIKNPDGEFHGPVRLRLALANDYLVPAMQVFVQMGAEQVWSVAQQLGLESFDPPSGESSYRLLLEGGEISLVEISRVFGTLANQGVLSGVDFSEADNADIKDASSQNQPWLILRATDRQNKVWFDCTETSSPCRQVKRPVISHQLAFLLNHILSDETSRWPSLGHPNPLEIGRSTGAKIGVTQDGNDSWTVGYTPDLVVGVWLGNLDQNSSEPIDPLWSAGLWHAVIQYATREKPITNWEIPVEITDLRVCDPSGMLPTPNCPSIVNEVFLAGTEPTQGDTLFRVFPINRESGHIATIFTPAELIEEKVFMVVPPEAADWAKSAGLPTLPQEYDMIEVAQLQTDSEKISSPEIFSSIHGVLPVYGTAKGENFDYYRLQFGQGLNPTSWIQIGENIHEPVTEGQLAEWDTTELSGLYSLQVLVVDQDQNVRTAITQVTIDNQPPEISIQYPQDGQVIDSSEAQQLTIQADATDNLALDHLEFELDGQTTAVLTAPPFALVWRGVSGSHELRVKAFDQAGNQVQTSIQFSIGK
jgi:membrane carboxypeptidase/penicillin-binding protein